ncbi:hypothetical protein [Lysobacter sp. Root494]|uniref:hypothetical protein n=1 Tax=Lysobacter sp. Root494 TaxID=1736549 RepID=UPI0006F5F823|nr:hypothetical protein [Lysobacter sp. Root494]KQY51938.1 hypothetical protein ASD14_04495 [Lysobacter sp. Root494]
MSYRIEHDDSKRESFAEYKYRIYRGDRLIACYWHDYRGDEHGIEFLNGRKEPWPVGRMIDFLEGDGRHPLLSQRAVAYLESNQG